MTREATKRILEMIDEGSLDAKTIARDLLGYLSEDDVRDFAHRNDIPVSDDDDARENDLPEYDDDGMTDAEADADTLRMAGMGTDEDYGLTSGDEW